MMGLTAGFAHRAVARSAACARLAPHPPRHPPGFRRLRLAALLLPLVGLALVGWWSWDGVTAASRDEMARAVDLVHEQALRVFETQDAVLTGMGAFISGMDWAEIRTSAAVREFARSTTLAAPAGESIALIDPLGRVALASAPLPALARLPGATMPLDDTPARAPWAGRGADRVGLVGAGETGGARRVLVTRPRVLGDGTADGGVLVSSFPSSCFDHLFATLAGAGGGGFALLRADGVVLARYPRPASGAADAWAPDESALAAMRGEVPTVASGGGRVRFAVSGALLTGLRMVAVRPLAPYGLIIVHRLDPGRVAVAWFARMLPAAAGMVAAAALLLLLTSRAESAALREALELRYRTEAAEAGRRRAQERAELEALLRRSERVAVLGRFAAEVAHDFNNLLQIMVSNGELLLRQAAPGSPARQEAALVVAASERGVTLTRRMLDHARGGEAPHRPDAAGGQAIDVGAAVMAVDTLMGEALRTALPGRAHHLRLDLAPGLPPARGDTAECESVLLNLVANARDAMPAGGEIVVAAALAVPRTAPRLAGSPAEGRFLLLTVRDRGVGMDGATLERAGEAFFTTKPMGEGSGLGLAMARGFARRNGGTLEVASTAGCGTTVSLWLPVAPGGEGREHPAR